MGKIEGRAIERERKSGAGGGGGEGGGRSKIEKGFN